MGARRTRRLSVLSRLVLSGRWIRALGTFPIYGGVYRLRTVELEEFERLEYPCGLYGLAKAQLPVGVRE